MDGCTFTPMSYTSKGNETARKLSQFIKDQEAFTELKVYNTHRRTEEKQIKELELMDKPKINNLSN